MLKALAFAAAPLVVGVNAWASAEWVIPPFGNISQRLEEKSPIRDYVSEDGYGFAIRAQKIPTQCKDWSKALVSDEMAADHGGVRTQLTLKDVQSEQWQERWLEAWKTLEPWSEFEIKMIRECDGSPCRVKINRAEGKRMDEAGESGRTDLYRSLVGDRVAHYLKTGEHLETEIPIKPMEPWAFLEGKGLKSTLKRPETAVIWTRTFREQKDDEVQIRQFIDRRTAHKPDFSEAVVWVRDAYTDHFFDSWGQFTHVKCERDGSGVLLQTLFLEVDLLKKNDLITRIARGKIRGNLGERSGNYLEQELETLLQVIIREQEKSEKAKAKPKSQPKPKPKSKSSGRK